MVDIAPRTSPSSSAYVLPDLAYDYGALEPLYSAEMLALHHGKHHAA